MKTEKYFYRRFKSPIFGLFTVKTTIFGLLFLLFSCGEKTLKHEDFPIEWIKNNSFERGSENYLLTDYERNAKVDYQFYKNWLKARNFEVEFCNPENMTMEQKNEMEQNGYNDFCEYSTGTVYHFLDHYESANLFFFTIAIRYSPPAGYWNTTFYHFTFDKVKKKVISRDFLTSIGGSEEERWDSDINYIHSSAENNETIFWITETEQELLAKIDKYVYDSIIVKRKKMVFSKNPALNELCDSVTYNMKSCGN